MIHSAVKVLPVALSIALVASCLPSCYTLAYADELQGVESVFTEEQEEIAGDSSGFELALGGGESSVDAADGGAAAEGYGPDVETTEGAIEDTTSGYGEVDSFADSDVSAFGNDFGGIGFAADGNEDSSQFGISSSNGNSSGIEEDSITTGGKGTLEYLQDIVYLLGEIADYYRTGQAGISPLADINSVYDKLVSLSSSLGSMLGMTEGRSSASNRYTWTLNGYSWSTGKTGVAYLISWIVTMISSGNMSLVSINNNLRTTHTFPGASSSSTEGAAEILWRISYLLYDQTGGRSVGNTIGSLLSEARKQWGTGYGGTRVIEVNSPAYWLEGLYTYSYATHTFAGESSSTTKGVAEILWRMDSKLWDTNRSRSVGNIVGDLLAMLSSVNERDSRSNAWGYDYSSSGGNFYANSPAGWLNWLYKYSWTTHTFAGDDSQTTKGFSEILWLIDSKLYDSSRGRTVGNVLGDVLSALVSHSSLSSKGFSDVLSMLDALSNSGSPVDLSETNKLLGRLTADVAGLRDKFVLQDSLSDLLDILVGDMQVPQTQAAISRIQDVMSTRFPFCIPSVVNVVLFGSLLADPAPPVWTFDIGGSPLVVDFADYGVFAEVSSWTVRLLFTAALLLNTRRFVYGVGGGY